MVHYVNGTSRFQNNFNSHSDIVEGTLFLFKLIWQKNQFKLMINHLNCFQFWLWIRGDIQIFMRSAYSQNSVYYQHMEFTFCIQYCIISIQTISFSILSANTMFFLKSNTNSAYFQNALNFVPYILSILYDTFHSVYFPYMLNFVPHFIRVPTFLSAYYLQTPRFCS